ncbi:MAG: glycine cleavage system protein GcvH [Thermoplasmata archaeon]|uniref:Probable glycine cleavage system H protein n=1 Tax=Candidatus Aciduliprofundum boonei TaxID=379547 RepID=A0A7J3T997_9ARCH|nr:glycine cleavage system protein GcvH [Thermoplasmata archaeon]HHE75534.1 glycine cleavage system protein GcvH [Candidatus Aciduliprofundum boonei]
MIPENLKYTKTHEWVKIEDGKVKMGITYHAQEQLHDIVYVELPEVGTEINKGDPLGVIESVKAASDIYSPVSGKVIAVNQNVIDQPEVLNQDPYENWLVEIEMNNPKELDELLGPEEYKKVVEEES